MTGNVKMGRLGRMIPRSVSVANVRVRGRSEKIIWGSKS
jgi:hypothetical protein